MTINLEESWLCSTACFLFSVSIMHLSSLQGEFSAIVCLLSCCCLFCLPKSPHLAGECGLLHHLMTYLLMPSPGNLKRLFKCLGYCLLSKVHIPPLFKYNHRVCKFGSAFYHHLPGRKVTNWINVDQLFSSAPNISSGLF